MHGGRPASELLEDLIATFPGETVSVGELIDRLDSRAHGMLLLVLALPMCVPNVPGISTIFGVLMLVCIQTSYLTPPMAPAIFYLQSVAPPEMTYGDICRGMVPFVLCQIATLGLVFAWPALATWLPGVLRAF